MLGCRWAARVLFLGGAFSLFFLGSSSPRSRWVGGHRVFYASPTAAAHVAVCKSWANYSSGWFRPHHLPVPQVASGDTAFKHPQ